MAIASAAYAALDHKPGGMDYSGLLDDLRHAGGDPHRAASAASDRHDDLVRKLEAERAQRDEVEAKRARLADALAFDTPGSRLDVFARAHRGTIEAQLRRFGLAGADADSSYRNLARDVSTIGAGGRVGVVIRSIWAYGSQARLLLWGICRLRARLHPSVSARPNGDRRDRAWERIAETRRGLGGGARRLVRSSGANSVHPWRAWPSRSTYGARLGSRTFCCAAPGC